MEHNVASRKRKAERPLGAADECGAGGGIGGLSAVARKLLRGPASEPLVSTCRSDVREPGKAGPAAAAAGGRGRVSMDGARCRPVAGAGAGCGAGCCAGTETPAAVQSEAADERSSPAPAKKGSQTAAANGQRKLSLLELVEGIDAFFKSAPGKGTDSLKLKLPVQRLLESYDSSTEDYMRYCFFDKGRAYTRNLVSTDNKSYTLMLLCWNSGKESPIHDHPCNGCWLKVLKGQVRETRYKEEGGSLRSFYSEVAKEGEVAYMHDCMGYHKVGADTVDSVTLHLYSPPYTTCQVFLDEADASVVAHPVATHYSEYGEKIVDFS